LKYSRLLKPTFAKIFLERRLAKTLYYDITIASLLVPWRFRANNETVETVSKGGLQRL